MLVVSDTGPIHYLVLIDLVATLPDMGFDIAVPPAVFAELSREGAPEVVRQWVGGFGRDQLTISQAEPLSGATHLGQGEREAISLAMSLHAPLLCDDQAAVRYARSNGLAVTGTLGVLQQAHLAGLCDIEQALGLLSQTTFHHTPELFELLVADTRAMTRRWPKPPDP